MEIRTITMENSTYYYTYYYSWKITRKIISKIKN